MLVFAPADLEEGAAPLPDLPTPFELFELDHRPAAAAAASADPADLTDPTAAAAAAAIAMDTAPAASGGEDDLQVSRGGPPHRDGGRV